MFANKIISRPEELCYSLFKKQRKNPQPVIPATDTPEIEYGSLFTVYYPSASTDSNDLLNILNLIFEGGKLANEKQKFH